LDDTAAGTCQSVGKRLIDLASTEVGRVVGGPPRDRRGRTDGDPLIFPRIVADSVNAAREVRSLAHG
jgi:hypothetical protein